VLPPELATALRPVLPELAEATIAAIAREVPEYARPMEGPFGQAVRAGVERALARFVDRLERPEGDEGEATALYEALGRGEFRAGRPLDALLAAYRLGARLAWERFRDAGVAAGQPPDVLYALASEIFAYIDGISAESVEGYAQERAAAEGERRRVRRALVRLLGRDDVPVEAVEEAAREAAWTPRRLVAAVLAPGDRVGALEAVAPGEVVAAHEDGRTIAWVADPDAPGRLDRVEAAAPGAAIGPGVPVASAPLSLRRARMAAAAGVGRADEHLLTLLLHAADPALAAEHAARALAPLEGLAPGPRAKLEATLRAWLDHPGQVQRIGLDLRVHPQTVRYRLARLRERFGDALDDPEARFALAVALRVSPRSGR
jgi:hypothetical protein